MVTASTRQSALAGSSMGIHEQAVGLARFYLDGPLVTALILLSGVGLVVLYSAGGQDIQLLARQGVRLAMAFVAMLVVAQIGPQRLLHWTPWLYAAGLVLLLVVLAVGDIGKGAQRWLRIGAFNFQPSELVKVTVPMMIAYYFADRSLPPRLPRLLVAIVLVLVPTLLVARQPDLGTALLIGSAGAFVIFLAGVHWRWIGASIVGIGALTPLVWFFMRD
ncbi:MAG: rod shape-determining protein RodA, partial [Gammaproteobacteria bacterium]